MAEHESGSKGFVVGSIRPAGFYRRLLRRRCWRFALASVLPVLQDSFIVAPGK